MPPSNLAQLNDAAVAVTYALDRLEIEYGFFGTYAVAVLGNVRQNEDIDYAPCAVGCTKEYLTNHLRKFGRFSLIEDREERADVATYLYTFELDEKSPVQIKFYPISMSTITTLRIHIGIPRAGQRSTRLLSLAFIFKGLLQDAFYHLNPVDIQCLHYLQEKDPWVLRAQIDHFNRLYVGKIALKNPETQSWLEKLNLDIPACREKWATRCKDELQNPLEINLVQNGLLFHTHER